MGRHQAHALRFALKHPGWHSFRQDTTTVRIIRSLERKGLVAVNAHGQFTALPAAALCIA